MCANLSPLQAALTTSNIEGVYTLAEKYQFVAASAFCREVMANNLTPSNVLSFLLL